MDSLSILIVLMAIALVAVAGVSISGTAFQPKINNPARLPDHDLSNLLPSATSTKWRHSYSCTECHSPVGHQEFMTQICLTCGQRMKWLPRSSAFRDVVRHGRWVRHQSPGNWLEIERGRWLSPANYDAEEAARSALGGNADA